MIHQITDIIPTLNRPRISGLLTGCAYAVRQQISLGEALNEQGIQIDGVNDEDCFLLPELEDIEDNTALAKLAVLCSQRMLQVSQELEASANVFRSLGV